MNNKYEATSLYIKDMWEKGLRKGDHNPDYPLPHPFEAPCINGLFQCLFYWDTFFTNRGMILDNKVQYAKWNTEDLIFLLNKYGCVPNSNSYPGIKHASQPPYLQYMIRDVYEATKDDEWLKQAYYALKKEYDFWMTKRITPIGLNQYLHHPKTEQEKIDFYDYCATRIALDKNAPRNLKIRIGASLNACGESGCDLTPTILFNGEDMVEVDLNCHMFAMEGYLSELASRFEPDLFKKFKDAQIKRKCLMDKYMFDENNGLYWNYNFVEKKIEQQDFHYAGQFLPFIFGLSTDKKALLGLLCKLEYAYGVAETEKYPFKYEHQSAYPYSWPFDNCFAFWALSNLGLKDDAKRVGIKYLEMCSNSYIASGHLWEVYSAVTDGIAEKKEYPNAEMLGWTAGFYQWIYFYLFKGVKPSY